MRIFLATAIGLATLGVCHQAPADLIAISTSGTGTGGRGYFGQSFTTPLGLAETNIVFNLFSDVPATTPYAIGTGFLLSQEYLGTPGALGISTPGYLGMAAASGGFYNFGSAVTLSAGTRYYFYENAYVPNMANTGGGYYVGGHGYYDNSSANGFGYGADSSNFAVTGSAVVPEPASLALCGVAGIGLAVGHVVRRRRT